VTAACVCQDGAFVLHDSVCGYRMQRMAAQEPGLKVTQFHDRGCLRVVF
jgi:hypothetical protein